jgi:AraC family transcriptional regulator
MSWPGLRTEYAWLPPHIGSTQTKPRQIGVSFSSHRRLVFTHAGRSVQRDVHTGAVWVTGEDGILWWRVREHTEALEMYPDARLLEQAAEHSAATIAVDAALGVDDGVTVGIASIFRRAHAADHALGDVVASQLAWRLVTHVVDRYTDLRSPPDTHVGLLDRRRLQRVCDYIEVNLADPISIIDLARLYGVTPFHFARSFKRTTGLAPQQYVTMRRMLAAKDMLLATTQPIAEIAYSVGFHNLSHFRRIFRLHYGASPSALRT